MNTAVTRAERAPVRISSRLVRSPSTAPMESMTMDLPAPVSPVRTLKPASKRMSADSISAIFSICSKESIALPHFLPDSGSLQQLVDLLDELLRQIVIPHN